MRARTQAEFAKARAAAERTLNRKLANLKRLVTSIQLWQRRLKYYTAQAETTDAERTENNARKLADNKARKAARLRSAAGARRIMVATQTPNGD